MRYANFGKTLILIRKEYAFTQSDLGQMIGVHSQYISNAERGICSLPTSAIRELRSLVSDVWIARLEMSFVEDREIQSFRETAKWWKGESMKKTTTKTSKKVAKKAPTRTSKKK